MKRWYRMIAAGVALALLAGCAGMGGAGQAVKPLEPGSNSGSGSVKIAPKPSETADQTLSAFGGKLLGEVRKEGENTLVSPLSVLLCLAMCGNGAEGETLQEFLDLLGGSGTDLDTLNSSCASLIEDYLSLEGSTECTIAGGLWVDERMHVKEDFLQRCADVYRAGAYQADLDTQETVDQVNGWVKEQTRGMIDGVLEDVPSPDAVLLLVNALYLKNAWKFEFDPNNTYEGEFHPQSGEAQTVSYLRNRDRDERYISTDTERGIILPYDDGRLAFLAVMPQSGDLSAYLAGWDGETLPRLLDAAEDTFLALSLPKFEAEWGGSLAEVLASMGLDTAFVMGQANFEGMGQADGPLYLSDVVHKTRIEVNEKGTEAAAVTAAMVTDCAAIMDEPERLVLDRPFVYGIVDLERQVPVFLGTFETAK